MVQENKADLKEFNGHILAARTPTFSQIKNLPIMPDPSILLCSNGSHTSADQQLVVNRTYTTTTWIVLPLCLFRIRGGGKHQAFP
jgi:hypothetical protein